MIPTPPRPIFSGRADEPAVADPIDTLRGAVDAVAVRPPLSFSWFGTSSGSIPPPTRRKLTETQLLGDLEERLALTLYANFYRRGSAAPMRGDNGGVRPDPSFVNALSRANGGRGSTDRGWTCVASHGSGSVVVKDGVAFTIDRAVPAGSRVTLILPKERLRLAPGYYMAIGDRDLDAGAPITRIYFNLDDAGAVALVRSVTTILNEGRVPFRLKIADHPSRFDRCDSGVLYARRRDRARLWPLLRIVRARLGARIGATVPAFTKQIAPGIAAADEPRSGESFGMDRCRLAARGLIRAAMKCRSGPGERIAEIERAFAERELDLRQPFLNPQTRDIYDPLSP